MKVLQPHKIQINLELYNDVIYNSEKHGYKRENN
jgi:hypothetical protein